MATAPPATGRSRAPRQNSQHYGSSGCVHLTAPPRGSAPHRLASGDLVHVRRCTSTHTLTFVSPEDPRRAKPPSLLSSSPGQAELPAPCRAESRVLPQGLARLSCSMIPNHSAGWMDWACDRQDFEKMQEFGRKGALQPPGQLAEVTCPTWARELGEARQRPLPRLLSPTGSPRGPTEKPLTARYLQLDPAPGLRFPPCFLLPRHPQHLSTEIVPSLKLESTNRSRQGCGMRAGGKDRRCVQDWGAAAWGDGDGQVPRGVPQEGRGQAETASRSPGTGEGRAGQGRHGELGFGIGSHHSSWTRLSGPEQVRAEVRYSFRIERQ